MRAKVSVSMDKKLETFIDKHIQTADLKAVERITSRLGDESADAVDVHQDTGGLGDAIDRGFSGAKTKTKRGGAEAVVRIRKKYAMLHAYGPGQRTHIKPRGEFLMVPLTAEAKAMGKRGRRDLAVWGEAKTGSGLLLGLRGGSDPLFLLKRGGVNVTRIGYIATADRRVEPEKDDIASEELTKAISRAGLR